MYIREVRPNDWESVRVNFQRLGSAVFGAGATPPFAGVELTGLTASTLVGVNASKVTESVTIGTGLNYTRPTLSLSHLGIESLTDPNADKILFWDDSETACKWLGVGNSIAITTTTLDTIQDIRTSASPTFVGLTLSGIAAEATDVDKFLVDSTGIIKYRTGAQVLSDIGAAASAHTHDDRYYTETEIDAGYQPLDAGLTSLAGLTYASDSFIKVTATDTYAIRTIAETKTDLSLNLVENIAVSGIGGNHLTWNGTALDVGDDWWDSFADISLTAESLIKGSGANKAQAFAKGANGTVLAVNGSGYLSWLAHANWDTAYTHSGVITGNPHSVTKSDVGLGSVENTALSTWAGTVNITTLGTIATGTWQATDVGIAYGGTGQSTAQLAINALTAVAAATNEHVLTKDTTTGNAIFKAAAGGGAAFTSKCSVYKAGTQTISNQTWTKVLLDTEVYDTDGEFDNATNYRFQPAVTGYYAVSVCAGFQASGDNVVMYAGIYKSGSIWESTPSLHFGSNMTYGINCTLNKDIYLTTSDYVELWVWHNKGSNATLSGGTNNCYMTVHRFA